jgi:hypothetical protein
MLWKIYIKKRLVYFPTVARTDAGLYMHVEPVEVVPLSEVESLKRALADVISRGNPIVPHPTRNAFPKGVLLSYAKVKTWSAFERGTACWHVSEHDGKYEISRWQPAQGGGYIPDPATATSLPSGTTIDEVAKHVVTRLQEGL